MAGTVNISLQQQFDSQGLPLGGGKLYTFQSGTSTPQSAFKDVGLTLANTNPVELDSSGRVPALFFADGTIKLRLTDRNGLVVFEADSVPVLGASSGGSGGSSVDATTVLATGDVKARYGTGALSGFVRANGRTIGPASSGATERAAADCQALFEYLWNNDSTLTVSGGRGASSSADWGTGTKTIVLPDMRGRVLAGLDDMGATSASRLSSILSSTTLGAVGGAQNIAIAQGNLPAVKPTGAITFTTSGSNLYTPAGSITFANSGTNAITPAGTVSGIVGTISGNGGNVTYTDPGHPHGYIVAGANTAVRNDIGNINVSSARATSSTDAAFTNITIPSNNVAATLSWSQSGSATLAGTANSATFGGVSTLAGFVGDNLGNGTAVAITQPTMAITLYIKL